MLEIELVVDVLKDDEWHELDEIVEKCRLSEAKIKSILVFLVEFGFVETDGGGRKVKVGSSLKKFLEETLVAEV